ncbi:hypothetical protein CEXT_308881 [Caerostris extrusa]|uniref:Uncharacterized protein n=1 Tax=Caerostris extrusa TaxID=172846 RepID=A0AAV4MR73_CAEEX|nr:hypothetical protein CEXT_308881 [Caerostris extrusa]
MVSYGSHNEYNAYYPKQYPCPSYTFYSFNEGSKSSWKHRGPYSWTSRHSYCKNTSSNKKLINVFSKQLHARQRMSVLTTTLAGRVSMPEQSNDYRVVVFGAGGVGKSSLVLRFVKGTSGSPTYQPLKTHIDRYVHAMHLNTL